MTIIMSIVPKGREQSTKKKVCTLETEHAIFFFAVLSTSHIAGTESLTKATLGRTVYLGSRVKVPVQHRGKSGQQEHEKPSCPVQSQKEEDGEFWDLACPLLFLWSSFPGHRMEPSIVRAGLLSSINLI